ncbi:protein Hikeshi-like [Watersipora subatra]|uniref:protein Hikeshi-like n=1 Tax=Watersipora subatra TaxID=2589382 RepID=UPI00355B5CB5
MFGILVAGRLVQTNLRAVTETQFVTEIDNADSVNHIVVFMTGVSAFPDGMAASVHFCWPETGWSLLGFITNEKPSVIFKISGLKPGAATSNPFSAHSTHVAQVGISVESCEQLSQQTPVSGSTPSTANSYAEFTQKMAENFFNFAGSFAISQSQMSPQPNMTFVPFNVVEQWYNNMKRKLEVNPEWWKK